MGKNGKANSRRRGLRRPVEFVRHPDTDEPVHGLRFHKSSSRYYRIGGGGKRHYYKAGGYKGIAYLRRAVYLHELWLKGQIEPDTITVGKAVTAKEREEYEIRRQYEQWYETTIDRDGTHRVEIDITGDLFWAKVREELLRDRFEFAAKVGVPEIAYLDRLRPPENSVRLSDVGMLYLNKRRKLARQTRADSDHYWSEFCDLVDAETVYEITAERIRNYHDTVFDRYEKGKLSPSWVSARFMTIKAILRHALTKGDDTQELQRVIGLCRMLVAPEPRETNPRPITRQHFHALLDAADTKLRAILLLMLNAAMKPTAVTTLRKGEIDLDKGTLVTHRRKAGRIVRICVLWQRTTDAIRSYQEEHPHDGETLFISGAGGPIHPRTLSSWIRGLRDKVGVPSTVKAEDLRDGAYTAAIQAGADLTKARLLAGHATGISDHYVKRNPMMVADACAAIERHYFGKEMKRSKKKAAKKGRSARQ